MAVTVVTTAIDLSFGQVATQFEQLHQNINQLIDGKQQHGSSSHPSMMTPYRGAADAVNALTISILDLRSVSSLPCSNLISKPLAVLLYAKIQYIPMVMVI